MQQDPISRERIIGRRKWIRPLDTNNQYPTHLENGANHASRNDIAMQPTLSMKSVPPTPHLSYDPANTLNPDPFAMQPDADISSQITASLMQLSGRIPVTPILPQTQ